MRLSIDMMPYLLFGHLLVAICVFGHPDFFQSGVWLSLEQIKVKEHGTIKTVGTDGRTRPCLEDLKCVCT